MPRTLKDRRRWTMASGEPGRTCLLEEVTGDEWDRLPEGRRTILQVPPGETVYARVVEGRIERPRA